MILPMQSHVEIVYLSYLPLVTAPATVFATIRGVPPDRLSRYCGLLLQWCICVHVMPRGQAEHHSIQGIYYRWKTALGRIGGASQ